MYLFDEVKDVNFPSLDDGQLYIYVILNEPQGNIKVGRTSNIKQRLRSLSGSNGGGNRITRIAVSDSTYLYTLEGIIHQKFSQFRVPNTEWFVGEDLCFDDVVRYVDSLFDSHEYEVCNQVRKDFVMKHGISIKEDCEEKEKTVPSH